MIVYLEEAKATSKSKKGGKVTTFNMCKNDFQTLYFDYLESVESKDQNKYYDSYVQIYNRFCLVYYINHGIPDYITKHRNGKAGIT